MKPNRLITILAMLLVLGAGVMVWAQQNMRDRQQRDPMAMKDKTVCTCPMKLLTGQELVVTSDGGAIVLIADKLLKYDGQLQLVAEAEIPLDLARLQEKVKEMMQNCPLHQPDQEEQPEDEPTPLE